MANGSERVSSAKPLHLDWIWGVLVVRREVYALDGAVTIVPAQRLDDGGICQ